tara:strand:+ start:2659 stop:3444 length:786 start_codon:yes stop_codon:yes gene_type:complete
MQLDIILPTFNSEISISRTLDSLVKAGKRCNFITLNILVADGGSTDETINILYSYSSQLSIKIVSKSDSSSEEGQSKAFLHSTGEYITVIGSDDYISDDYFLELEEFGLNEQELLLPQKFTILKQDDLGILKTKKVKSPKWFFLHRYSIPLPGIGWITKTNSLREFVRKRENIFMTNNYKIATDSELFVDLINAGWKYKKMRNPNASYYFLEGGNSSSNLIPLSYEQCEIHCKNSKFFSLDIFLVYLFRRNLLRFKRIFDL